VFRTILFLAINLLIFALVLNRTDVLGITPKQTEVYVRHVYAKPNYKYWTYLDGTQFCKENKGYESLDAFSSKKSTIIYFENVTLLECISNIKNIAYEFHKRHLEVAINLENSFEYDRFFKTGFTEFSTAYYKEKFKEADVVNDWLDYIVFDNSMEFLTYVERRRVEGELRRIFTKPFIGFRFTKNYAFDPISLHPVRKDKQVRDFMPYDGDGDFIITGFEVHNFKKTKIFNENISSKTFIGDGEFVR